MYAIIYCVSCFCEYLCNTKYNYKLFFHRDRDTKKLNLKCRVIIYFFNELFIMINIYSSICFIRVNFSEHRRTN